MIIINSQSEIRQYVDSETLSKYAIVVMLYAGRNLLEPGLLRRFGDHNIIFDGIYLYHTSIPGGWIWPALNAFSVDEVPDIMEYIFRIHNAGKWTAVFYILQDPIDVSWFIHEFNIPNGEFKDRLESTFITSRRTIPRKL